MRNRSILLRWAVTISLLVCVLFYQALRLQQEGKNEPMTVQAELPAERGSLHDGTYTGMGKGYGGDIEVEVTVENGYIAAITVTSAEGEDKPYLRDAKKIISKVIAIQHTNLDAISGSTSTTWGILDAVDDALKEADDE